MPRKQDGLEQAPETRKHMQSVIGAVSVITTSIYVGSMTGVALLCRTSGFWSAIHAMTTHKNNFAQLWFRQILCRL